MADWGGYCASDAAIVAPMCDHHRNNLAKRLTQREYMTWRLYELRRHKSAGCDALMCSPELRPVFGRVRRKVPLARYFNSSPEVIRLVVMMHVRFPLSLRNVEDLLFERGIDISRETVRVGAR